MSITLAQIKSQVRERLGDDGTFIQKIIPIGICDGVNKVFQIPTPPLNEASFSLYQNDSLVSSAGYTLDNETGELVFATAPIIGTPQWCSYTYYSYSDNQIADLIHRAEQQLRTLWTTSYIFSGSGSAETITSEPDEEHAEALMLLACIMAIGRSLAIESRNIIYKAGQGGTIDTRTRVQALRDLRKDYRAELITVLKGMGVSNNIVTGEHEYGIVHEESWL